MPSRLLETARKISLPSRRGKEERSPRVPPARVAVHWAESNSARVVRSGRQRQSVPRCPVGRIVRTAPQAASPSRKRSASRAAKPADLVRLMSLATLILDVLPSRDRQGAVFHPPTAETSRRTYLSPTRVQTRSAHAEAAFESRRKKILRGSPPTD